MERSYGKFSNVAPVPINHVLIEAPFVSPNSEKNVLLFVMFTLITMFAGNVYKFAMFTGKHLCWSPFLIKMRAFTRATYQKMTATQVLFCKYCKILSRAYIKDLL